MNALTLGGISRLPGHITLIGNGRLECSQHFGQRAARQFVRGHVGGNLRQSHSQFRRFHHALAVIHQNPVRWANIQYLPIHCELRRTFAPRCRIAEDDKCLFLQPQRMYGSAVAGQVIRTRAGSQMLQPNLFGSQPRIR